MMVMNLKNGEMDRLLKKIKVKTGRRSNRDLN